MQNRLMLVQCALKFTDTGKWWSKLNLISFVKYKFWNKTSFEHVSSLSDRNIYSFFVRLPPNCWKGVLPYHWWAQCPAGWMRAGYLGSVPDLWKMRVIMCRTGTEVCPLDSALGISSCFGWGSCISQRFEPIFYCGFEAWVREMICSSHKLMSFHPILLQGIALPLNLSN